ncbi:MAG: glycosyltransferase [Acidimicrobiales bacterium]
MQRLAVLSMHTSPLAQPGTGDGGGMNVYVRELSSSLARAGIAADVYTRTESPDTSPIVEVEPGLTVHHVEAGPLEPLEKHALHGFTGAFAEAVAARIEAMGALGVGRPDAIHANYWLSGIAGHALKHELGVPLVSTFHTLDRVKAEASPEDVDPADPDRRSHAEAQVIGCSDAVLASCAVEVDQLVDLYDADPTRVEIVAPGVDHAFFSPGDQAQARRALSFPADDRIVLFVGRLQPLKAADVAIEVVAGIVERARSDARLVVVGGPSGRRGEEELAALHKQAADLGVADRVDFVPPQRHELLSTFYRAADVCVVPSRSESFGLVALEAAACGIPVVASSVGGLTTLVEHQETGFLVEGRDSGLFARYVERLLVDAELRSCYGEAGAARARPYTWTFAAARLRRIYQDLADRALVDCF